ncbi:hypothetical protein HDU96_007020 [Phlyctochytrium bullatum]|nr:hypothetical protein HDU96_007020 [Phlyctochytrium bullatum]
MTITDASSHQAALIDLDNVSADLVVEIYQLLSKSLGPDFAARPKSADAAAHPFRLTISIPEHMNATMALLKVAADATSQAKTRDSAVTASGSGMPAAKKRRVSEGGPNLQDAVACDHAMEKVDLSASPTVSSALALGLQTQANDLFFKAVEAGDAAAVRLFLAAGASPAMKNAAGMAAIHIAVINDDEDVLQAMLDSSKGVINLQAEAPIADFAIEKENWCGLTPLQAASLLGKHRTAKVLLERGADVEALGPCRNRALHMAAKCGHAEVARLLLDHAGDIWPEDRSGDSPLHIAAAWGHHDVCKVILEKDEGGIDYVGDNADTALHLAVEEGHKKVIEVLLSFGAEVEIENKNGLTALQKARNRTRSEPRIAALLEKALADRAKKS